ncbi:MAG: lipopolysaccharide transport periplasmic protein LptA [Paracoccaceae bacterium]|nr:MAG: lipopolysaccharide transport periplasmic protein LptA [Paracoccaceae bacterium]
MRHFLRLAGLAAGVSICAAVVSAQGAGVQFPGLRQDAGLPVEVSADSLSVDQAAGGAVFSGNVIAIQGDLRLTAAEVRVRYAEGGGGIETMHATGGVTLVSPTEAAEAAEAVYTIGSGSVVMTGNVLLTQGQNAISGQRLVIDLRAGTGVMEGRVTTVFTPGAGAAPKN